MLNLAYSNVLTINMETKESTIHIFIARVHVMTYAGCKGSKARSQQGFLYIQETLQKNMVLYIKNPPRAFTGCYIAYTVLTTDLYLMSTVVSTCTLSLTMQDYRKNTLGHELVVTGLLPALHHRHDHPVICIDILSNQILKHDEGFHQEILKQRKQTRLNK